LEEFPLLELASDKLGTPCKFLITAATIRWMRILQLLLFLSSCRSAMLNSEHTSRASAVAREILGVCRFIFSFFTTYGTLSPGNKSLFPVSSWQLPYPLKYYFFISSRLRWKKVDFEYRILDLEYCILDFYYRILDFEYRIFWTSNIVFWT
jgi:hypothetical protein